MFYGMGRDNNGLLITLLVLGLVPFDDSDGKDLDKSTKFKSNYFAHGVNEILIIRVIKESSSVEKVTFSNL